MPKTNSPINHNDHNNGTGKNIKSFTSNSVNLMIKITVLVRILKVLLVTVLITVIITKKI